MKKFLLSFLLAAVWMPTSVLAQALWQEGAHYTVVAEQATSKPQVLEVFSFWCPHCYTFEAIAKQIDQQLPEGVDFVKAHVDFLGGASKDTQRDATIAMLAAKAMGESTRFNDALFKAIHKERRNINGMQDIEAVFAQAGGDVEKLAKLSKSFGIKGQLKRNQKYIQGVRRVPTFIVNGKYQAIFTRDMKPDDFVQLILWLTNQK